MHMHKDIWQLSYEVGPIFAFIILTIICTACNEANGTWNFKICSITAGAEIKVGSGICQTQGDQKKHFLIFVILNKKSRTTKRSKICKVNVSIFPSK